MSSKTMKGRHPPMMGGKPGHYYQMPIRMKHFQGGYWKKVNKGMNAFAHKHKSRKHAHYMGMGMKGMKSMMGMSYKGGMVAMDDDLPITGMPYKGWIEMDDDLPIMGFPYNAGGKGSVGMKSMMGMWHNGSMKMGMKSMMGMSYKGGMGAMEDMPPFMDVIYVDDKSMSMMMMMSPKSMMGMKGKGAKMKSSKKGAMKRLRR